MENVFTDLLQVQTNVRVHLPDYFAFRRVVRGVLCAHEAQYHLMRRVSLRADCPNLKDNPADNLQKSALFLPRTRTSRLCTACDR